MTVTRYGYGPELVNVGMVQKRDGTLVAAPGGGAGFSVDVDSEAEADALFSQLGDVFIDGEWVRPVYSSPQRVGGRPFPANLAEATPETRRLMRVTMPAGNITKVRVYVDGNGSGPGDPQIRAALTNAAGVVQGTSNTLILGRNSLSTSAIANQASSSTSTGTYSRFVTTNGAASDEGISYSASTSFNAFPGEPIMLSAYLKGATGGEVVRFQNRAGTSTGALLVGPYGPNITLTTDWQQYSWATTVPTSPNGAVTNSLKIVTPTTQAISFHVDKPMLHRGTVLLPWHVSTADAGWYELPLTAPVAWPGGDGYLVLHVGPDLAAATATSTFSSAPSAYNSLFGTDTSNWASQDATAAISRDTTWSHYSGTGSMRIDWTAAPIGAGARHTNSATVNPGDMVIVYARVKGTSTTSTVIKQEVSVSGTTNAAQSSVTLTNTSSTPELATTLVVEKAGTIQVDYTNGTASFTGSALVDVVRILILRRNSSRASSLRIASAVTQPTLVNTAYNPKAKVDLNGLSGYTGGSDATQSFSRVTTDAAMAAFGAATCAEFSGTGATASSVGAYMMGVPSGRIPRGMQCGVVLAAKLVSGSVSNFQFGVRTVDATNSMYGWTSLGQLNNPTAGRWYYFVGTFTAADEYATCQPSVVMSLPSGAQAYVTRLGYAQLTPNTATNPIYIDGDLPDGAFSGTEGYTESTAPIGRVNWIRDPLTLSTSMWYQTAASAVTEDDPASPTGRRVRIYNNTSTDPFSYAANISDINTLRVPALPGETWTLSGWWAVNQAMLDHMQTLGPTNTKQGPSLWYRNDGTYTSVSIPSVSMRPKTAGVYVPFAITVTMPQWNSSIFVRLYNGQIAGGGLESYYTGLKFERGTWPAGDYFHGGSAGCQWFGAPHQSESIMFSGYDIRDAFADGTANLPTLTPAGATGGESSIQALYI